MSVLWWSEFRDGDRSDGEVGKLHQRRLFEAQGASLGDG